MNPFRQRAEQLVEKAKALHAREREASLESVELVGEMIRRNAGGYLLLTTEDLARRIGLTPNQFWKRAQAARVLAHFPAFRELVVRQEATVTSLALISPRLTEANEKIFLAGIRHKTTAQVRQLAATTDFSGRSLMLKARREADDLLDRALAVARSRGRLINRDALLNEALGLWLEEWDEAPSLKKEA